jgi:hypothetical protein
MKGKAASGSSEREWEPSEFQNMKAGTRKPISDTPAFNFPAAGCGACETLPE